jgi:hypothetical protein
MRDLVKAEPNGRVSMEEYCRQLLADTEGGRRFEVNHREYRKLAIVTELTTFQMLAELYGHLAVLHRTRVEAARRWLAEASTFGSN